MASLPKNVLFYGKEDPLPDQIRLRAGPLSMVYENGDVRYIRHGQQEIIRRIYAAVRDRNWGTIVGKLRDVKMEIRNDSFRISYTSEHQEREIDFVWHAEIKGESTGTIQFSFNGTARSTFLKNRIGFCVLHPIRECAGKSCRVEYVSGDMATGKIPAMVSMEQPVRGLHDLKAIGFEFEPGKWADLQFQGDSFEMEDQRNWTDASFKTFCTPLRIPYPVTIESGHNVRQIVTLTLNTEQENRNRPEVTNSSDDEVTFSFKADLHKKLALPSFGVGMASHGEALSASALERLRLLHLSHLRCDLHFSQGNVQQTLKKAVRDSSQLGVPLELALFLTHNAQSELDEFRTLLEQSSVNVARFIVFHHSEKASSERWLKMSREVLARFQAPIGGGTNADFYQLNQFRPPADLMDFVSFSINPQVHAFDNASLAETLEAQVSPVESAKEYFRGLPVFVSPITLKPRFNPVATGPELPPAEGELPSQVDPRQMSLFGAGWTLGSIKYIARGAASGVTYYETEGWRGLMEIESGSPLPSRFQSVPGGVFPLFHVFADVGEFRDGHMTNVESSHPLAVEGLALKKNDRLRMLFTNFTSAPRRVKIIGLNSVGELMRMNETNVLDAMRDPRRFRTQRSQTIKPGHGSLVFELDPFEFARLDSTA